MTSVDYVLYPSPSARQMQTGRAKNIRIILSAVAFRPGGPVVRQNLCYATKWLSVGRYF